MDCELSERTCRFRIIVLYMEAHLLGVDKVCGCVNHSPHDLEIIIQHNN